MKSFLSTAYILIAAILWGAIAVFYHKLTAVGFSSIQIVWLRVTSAAVLMAVYLAIRDVRLFKIHLTDIWIFLGTGIVSLAFFNYCYFRAIDELNPSTAAVLLYTAPMFVAVFSSIIFRERITSRKVFALVITFLGCVMVTGVSSSFHATPSGILFGIGSGVGYALYSIFGKIAIKRGYASETISFYTFLFASAAVLPICQPNHIFKIVLQDPSTAVINTIGIGFLISLLPYIFYTKGLQNVAPGRASVMATLEPVVATVIGVWLLNDTINVSKALGIMLIISAIAIVSVEDNKKEQKQ